MKCGHQTNVWAIIAALSPQVHSVFGASQITFQDDFIHGSISVEIGSPPTKYNLLIDTGSSNTWVGVDKAYNPTSTSQDTGDTVSVTYDTGSMSGRQYLDQVSLNPDLVIANQSIGVASSSTGLSDVDGILGLGPTDLTLDTVSNQGMIPTVLDNLFDQGIIEERIMHFSKETITFGGLGETLSIGDINYAPITKEWPASEYWGLDASIDYGDGTLQETSGGTIDYGSTLIMLSEEGYSKFLRATGAKEDLQTNLPRLDTCTGLQSMALVIGGEKYYLTPEQYTWPQDQNTAIGGQAGKCYLGVTHGNVYGFVIGYNTLKHLNFIIDAGNSQIGFDRALLEVNI